jgi:crotonobetainyl-CoA:carnitine CoA-transferase CaiB-like acyl-CoA transferase
MTVPKSGFSKIQTDADAPWTQSLCKGLTVLELASVLAGPSVGQFFAELGARVIKVENPSTRGDVTRTWRMPGESDSDRTSYFYSCNWGKESIALNLKSEEGIGVMHELVAASDVVISNYIPRAARKLQADYKTLKAINPDVILGSIIGYRPDSDRPGYDAIIQAEAGYYYINGNPRSSEWRPTKMPVPLMDILAGHQLKQALLMALLRKASTGRGAHVTVSLYDAAVSALTNQATSWLVAGKIPEPLGSEHPNIAPYGSVYQSADKRSLVLAVGTDRQFLKLCDILDLPNVASDERFEINQSRIAHREELKNLLQVAIRRFKRDDLLTRCEEVGIPAGAVRKMNEVFDEAPDYLQLSGPNGAARGVRETAIWPPSAPESMDHLAHPPSYAAHTNQVLREVLGKPDNAVQALLESGAVVQN